MSDLSNEPALPRADLTPTQRRAIDHVADIAKDAATLETTIATALHQLAQNAGGYSATTPGASPAEAQGVTECHEPDCSNSQPCPTHDGDSPTFGRPKPDRSHQLGHAPADKTTTTERQAGKPDKALNDQQHLTRLIRRIHRDMATAAKISQRWGTSGLNGREVMKRLNDALSTIWCVNCSFHGLDKRRTNGDYCEFCSGIKSKYKRYPNHQLCAMNAAGRRCMPSDVVAAFKADKQKDTTQDDPNAGSIVNALDRRSRRLKDAS